jgi:hypothetical protein
LGAMHTVEQSFSVENSSYSYCLGSIGYAREGSKFYYTVGFFSTAAVVCGPTPVAGGAPDMPCLGFQWQQTLNAAGTVTGYTAISSCAAAANSTNFVANQKEQYATLPAVTDLPNNTTITYTNNAPGFLIGGVANISSTVLDKWTISERKELLNTASGI